MINSFEKKLFGYFCVSLIWIIEIIICANLC